MEILRLPAALRGGTMEKRNGDDAMKMQAAFIYGPNNIRVEETDRPICPSDTAFPSSRRKGRGAAGAARSALHKNIGAKA